MQTTQMRRYICFRSIVELTSQVPWEWLLNASYDVNQGTQNKIRIVGVTLLEELFLTVHMLCTEKRLCTNPVKFLLSMLSALLSNSVEPRPDRCSFSQSPFAAIFTCFRRGQFRSSVSPKN